MTRSHNFKVEHNGKAYKMMGLEKDWKNINDQIVAKGFYLGGCKHFVLDNKQLLIEMGYVIDWGTKVKITKAVL